MVTSLLETVTGEISKTDASQIRKQAMRSPSPQKHANPKQAPGWPVGERANGANNESVQQRGVGTEGRPVLCGAESGSDYGDDDFDEDMLTELDASLLPARSREQSPSPPRNTSQPQTTPEAASFEDEFGDLDGDIFDAAEDLLAKMDPKQRSQGPCPAAQTNRGEAHGPGPAGVLGETEDAYGDDFGGDFDFEGAEWAATHSVQSTAPIPSSSVCTRR